MNTRPKSFLLKLAGLSIVAALGACQMEDGAVEESPDEPTAADPASEDVAESEDEVCLAVDPARSLVVTDPSIMALFPLQSVMAQIIGSAGGGVGPTPLALYQQWWDLLNDPAHGVTPGPHCTGTIGGFPVDCPRQEGILATTNPFVPGPDSYIPVALFNRFDLADPSGADCGEYRIVYAKESGLVSGTDRNFIIFEARLPNPTPSAGLTGCLPVADFWANLTTIGSPATRGALLHDFYFLGLGGGFAPVITWDHYAGSGLGSGQIRTNQFMTGRGYFGPPLGQPWELREFRTEVVCSGACNVMMAPETVKNNPAPFEFDPGVAIPFKVDFETNQVPLLAAASVNDITMDIPLGFDAGQSVAVGADDYAPRATGIPFLNNIQSTLTTIGSPLTPANILDRATTQSCAGCHQLSNGKGLGGGLVWPGSLGFVHVNENRVLSPALTGTFLPRRKIVLENCICGITC